MSGKHRGRPLAGTASKKGTGEHHDLGSAYRESTTDAGSGLGRAIRITRRDWWSEGALVAIQQLALSGRGFTSEHVIDLCGEPHEPHLLGAAFASAQRSKIITTVGAVVGRDGVPRRVWWACEVAE